MPVTIPSDYKPLLLPETLELAFATVRHTGEQRLAASHLRHVAPPVLVRATGAPGEVSFECRGIDHRLALPDNLEAWKRQRMEAYGIGAGYGLYTYTVIVDTDCEPANAQGPVCDRWDCIRSMEPEQACPETLAGAVRRVYALTVDILKAINKQFPHIHSSLPDKIHFADTPADSDSLLRLLREHQAVAAVDNDRLHADMYLWNDVSGCELHFATIDIVDTALSGWISPSMIALKVLRLCSLSEIFPIP